MPISKDLKSVDREWKATAGISWRRASIKGPISVPVSPSNAVKCYPCREVTLNYNRSLLFHGGDTGSTPVRDAKLLSIFKTRRDISRPMRFLMDFFGRCVTWIRGRNVFTDLFCAFRFSFFTTSAYLCIVTLILGQQSRSRMAWGSVDSILG